MSKSILRLASKNGHKEGRFSYGVILMALGVTEKGMKIINKLTDKEGLAIVDSCWENIQISLEHINLTMEKVYVKSLEKMKPDLNCHPAEMNTSCSNVSTSS